MNARGIPPAAQQVLHLLSYPRGRVPHPWLGGTLSWPGQYPIWLVHTPTWLGVFHPHVRDWDTPQKGPGRTSHWGTPKEGTWGQSLGYPPRKDMGPVEVLWDGDGVTPPPPGVNRQTPVKTVPSRRTTYAGGNKTGHFHTILYLLLCR